MVQSGQTRVLVLERNPGVIDDYRCALGPVAEAALPSGTETAGSNGSGGVELVVVQRTDRAAAQLGRARREGQAFAMVFVDPAGEDTQSALETLRSLRQADAEVPLVVVTARADLDPRDLSQAILPADRLFYLQKPFHGHELRQFTHALSVMAQSTGGVAEALQGASPAQGGDLSGALTAPMAGILLFDARDRLIAANGALRQLLPELADSLAPGKSYEDLQREIALKLLPEDTLFRPEAWLRDRMAWHHGQGGLIEQRLRGGRWLLIAEGRTADGKTHCHIHDISALKLREARKAAAARMSQMNQALAALYDRLDPARRAPETPRGSDKVVPLRPLSGAGSRQSAADGALQDGAFAELLRKLKTAVGRERLVPETCDLNAVMPEVLDHVRPLLPSSVQSEVIAGAGLWPVLADREKLALVLCELIENACEAMESGGRIVLETTNQRLDRGFTASRSGLSEGDYVSLVVRDSGPGMAPELAERALNPFFTSKGGDYLGLGLSVVHGFVKQSGGYMEIGDQRLGGTAVALYFPRCKARPNRAEGAVGGEA